MYSKGIFIFILGQKYMWTHPTCLGFLSIYKQITVEHRTYRRFHCLRDKMDKKQIAIVGAGISGLLACKYCLSKGFNPIVFESESDIGGVWAKTIKTTRLQSAKPLYQFSDFPWPSSVTDIFPTQQQTLDYLRSYATHFDLIPHIKFHSRVNGISFNGPISSDPWSLWNGIREPFLPEGKWNVTVHDTGNDSIQV